MEIPYIVEPRKDTGLFNSKIAIWLFLASEVMLFGGLFSAYIFLRLGADFPWPERALPILPGLINTAILILSSMTVVFAWTELKLRNWRMFQLYMFITIVCAAVFMVFKAKEYEAKFTHQAIRTQTFSVLEGHVIPKDEKHPHGLGNHFRVKSTELEGFSKKKEQGLNVSVTLTRFHAPYFENIFSQAGSFKSRLFLNKDSADSYVSVTVNGEEKKFDASTELTIENLEALKQTFLANRLNDNKLNETLLRQAWKQFRLERKEGKHSELDGEPDGVCVTTVSKIHGELVAKAQAAGQYLNFISAEDKAAGRVALNNDLNFQLIGEGEIQFVPAKGTFGGGTKMTFAETSATVLHRDNTRVTGAKGISGIDLAVDSIDFRHFIMKWESDDLDNKPEIAAYLGKVKEDGSFVSGPEYVAEINAERATKGEKPLVVKPLPIFSMHAITEHKHGKDEPTIAKIWETHQKWAHYHAIDLAKEGKELTENEKYMVTWKQIVAYNKAKYKCDSAEDADAISELHVQKWWVGMYGPNHYNEDWAKAFPHVFVDREEIRLESNLTPKWSNYYAIYFTITGLHGLHVIGGALVLAYYLFFGRKMFLSNPEWLCNRVEVGGLFWHFVDLVWIFAFPIFYLM